MEFLSEISALLFLKVDSQITLKLGIILNKLLPDLFSPIQYHLPLAPLGLVEVRSIQFYTVLIDDRKGVQHASFLHFTICKQY